LLFAFKPKINKSINKQLKYKILKTLTFTPHQNTSSIKKQKAPPKEHYQTNQYVSGQGTFMEYDRIDSLFRNKWLIIKLLAKQYFGVNN